MAPNATTCFYESFFGRVGAAFQPRFSSAELFAAGKPLPHIQENFGFLEIHLIGFTNSSIHE
jgi:hypothetical protein